MLGGPVSWVEQYRAGEHADAWRAMTAAGPDLRQDAAAWQDATAVAHETMRRVLANVERIHEALVDDGYEFEDPDRALVPPVRDAARQLDLVERAVGPLPLSLRAWLEVVGSVNFVGTHPDWEYEYTDALVVERSIPSITREYEDRRSGDWFVDEDRFPLDLAPDYLHKADVSGDSPYSIWLPDAGVDAPWAFDDLHETSFVGYLRSAILEWGGFPGWARRSPRSVVPTEPWPERLAELTSTFERF
jgi:hypothetical protein